MASARETYAKLKNDMKSHEPLTKGAHTPFRNSTTDPQNNNLIPIKQSIKGNYVFNNTNAEM